MIAEGGGFISGAAISVATAPIETPIITTFEEKAESIAMAEFINGELQWRIPSEDDNQVDES